MLSISRFRLSQFTDSLRQPARQNFGQGVWRYRLGHVIVHARLDAALPVADQHGEMRRPGTAPTRRLLPDLRSRRNSAPREGATPHPRVGFRSPAPESPESRRTRKLTDSSGGLPAGREVHQCPADRKWLSFHWADDGGPAGPVYDKPVSRRVAGPRPVTNAKRWLTSRELVCEAVRQLPDGRQTGNWTPISSAALAETSTSSRAFRS